MASSSTRDRRPIEITDTNTLFGREAELTQLTTFLGHVGRGSPRRVIIEGEPGIGKTRLADEATYAATIAGFTILRGVAEELHRDRPFGVIVDAVGLDIDSQDTERRRAAELLREQPGEASDFRHRIAEAIEDIVEREAMRRPLLLLIEDLHWADTSSVLALYAIAQRDDLPVFVLITSRPVRESRETDRLLDQIAERGGLRITLAGLSEEDIVHLAEAHIGGSVGPTLRGQLRGVSGNPLFALELLDALIDEQILKLTDGVADSEAVVRPPPSLRTLIVRRLGFLRRETLDALRVASVIGESFSARELALSTDKSVTDVLALLDAPITSGFVSGDADFFTFRHDVVREAIYADIPLAVRKGLHLHVGRTLAAAGADVQRVAPHIAIGAEPGDREAVAWLRDAGLDAAPRSPEIAADLLHHAAELLPPDDMERVSLLLPVVRQLAIAGRIEDASVVAGGLIDVVSNTPMEPMLALERMNLMIQELRYEDLVDELGRRLADPSTPEVFRTYFIAMYAGIQFARGSLNETRLMISEIRPWTDRFPDTAPATLLLWIDGVNQWLRGEFGESVSAFERAVPGTEMFIGGRGQGLVMLATALCFADRLDDAQRVLEEGRNLLERRGTRANLVEHHWFLSNTLFASGRWDDALAEMEVSRELTERTGVFGIGFVIPDPTPLILTFRGASAEAIDALSEVGPGPSIERSMIYRIWRDPLGVIVREGRLGPDEQTAILRSWIDEVRDADLVPDFRTTGRTLVRVCRSAGDDHLLRTLDEAASVAYERASGVKSVEGAALLVRGAVSGDTEILTSAMEASRAGGRPFDIAEAAAETGLALLKRGDEGRGRALVDEAFDLYVSLGARASEAALARTARAFGVRRGSRRSRTATDRGWDALTESERRVVALVREGLTNRDVGERLFISKGTVATHLRNVFRKLGASSRAEVAAQAARETD